MTPEERTALKEKIMATFPNPYDAYELADLLHEIAFEVEGVEPDNSWMNPVHWVMDVN